MEWIILVLGVLLVCISIYFFSKNNRKIAPEYFSEDKQEQIRALKEEVKEERLKVVQLTADLAREREKGEQLTEKIKLENKRWENLQEQNRIEFENLVSRLGKQNSEFLRGRNEEQMKSILSPLKEQMERFEMKIEKSSVDRNSLREELKRLNELNARISDEANNLTQALKGDNKQQGNWGEMILENILERSGLENGVEYETQMSAKSDEGKVLRPDVVIHLPEKKYIIIDSKVSLVAFERFVSCEDELERETYAKQHVLSLKSHIDGLNKKSYEHAIGEGTPDFVLLFVPIEASFSVALKQDPGLFNYAWDRRIVVVSPTTLLATLRTVSSVWRQEKQNKNAVEIARQSGLLFDKFVGFLEDMDHVGKSLDKSRDSYDKAMNKLRLGNGNLIDKANKIKELGARTKK